MMDILNLLEELLEHDPGSKIFFPLARLYRKQGEISKAADIMRRGIVHHPDYLEANFFLVELLQEQDAAEEAQATVKATLEKLLSYDRFWNTAKTGFFADNKPALALAAHIFELTGKSEKIDLLSLLATGIAYQPEESKDSENATEPEFDLDADEVARFCLNSGIKTKTMAKLCAAQGEYDQALEIYEELLSGKLGEEERNELVGLRNAVQAQLLPADAAGQDKGKKLFHMLNSLATRLEGRSS